jgi:ferredoxin
MVKIIREECIGCGVCANICPDGIEMVDGKAKIKDENADCLKEAADACPRNAILLNGENSGNKKTNNNPVNFGQGRGMGKGKGRGLGLGPRNGRGMGRGGGGRRW